MAAPLSREDSLGQMFLVGAGDGLYDTCKLSITSVIVIQQVFAIGNATLIHVWIRRLYVSVIEICLCPLLSWWQVSWPTGFLIPWMKLVRCQKSTIRLNVDIQHINTVCMRHSLYCESAGWMISISQPALAQYQWAKLVSAVLYMYTYVIRKWVFFVPTAPCKPWSRWSDLCFWPRHVNTGEGGWGRVVAVARWSVTDHATCCLPLTRPSGSARCFAGSRECRRIVSEN